MTFQNKENALQVKLKKIKRLKNIPSNWKIAAISSTSKKIVGRKMKTSVKRTTFIIESKKIEKIKYLK